VKVLERVRSEWRLVYGLAVLLVLAGFLFTLRSLLSPFTLFILLLLLLAPYAGSRRHRLLVIGASILTVLWLLETTGFLLAPFVLALVIAYILNPLVNLLARWRIPRTLAIVLLVLPFLGLLVLGAVFGVPALAGQVESLIDRAPEAFERVSAWLAAVRSRLARVDVPFVREDVVLQPLSTLDAERVVEFLRTRQAEIAGQVWGAVLGVGRGVGTALTIFGYVVLTPVLAFYLLRDYDRLAARLIDLVPRPQRESWLGFAREYDQLVSRYLRGQLLAALAVGVLTALGLWIARFPYAGLVGAVAGVFNLVPFLGLVVSLVPAVVIALLSGNILASFVKVAIVYSLVQLLDSVVIGPRIVGESVGLHPVWVMLALAVGGFFLGFVGLLLAVPVAALLKLLLRHALDRYRRSSLYLGESPVRAP